MEIKKLEDRVVELKEALAEAEVREKQYIVRQEEAVVREHESRDRLKHNRRLIAELQIHLEGGAAVRKMRSEKKKRNLKTLKLVSRTA